MRNKLFEIAALCYKKGDDSKGMLLALAMQFYKQGEPMRAARCFELSGQTQHAASCLRHAGDFVLAAAAYSKLGKPTAKARMLALAAEKSTNRRDAVELYTSAAAAWEAAGKSAQALILRLSQKELRREGIEMVRQRTELLQVALPHMERLKLFDAAYDVCVKLGDLTKADELARASAFYHKSVGDKDAMLAAVRSFSSQESQMRFLLKHGDRKQVVDLLEGRGDLAEALDECFMASEWDRADGIARRIAESEGVAPDDTYAPLQLTRVLRSRQAEDATALVGFVSGAGGNEGSGEVSASGLSVGGSSVGGVLGGGVEPRRSDPGSNRDLPLGKRSEVTTTNPLSKLMALDKLGELMSGAASRDRLVCAMQAVQSAAHFVGLDAKDREAHTISFLRIRGVGSSGSASHGKPDPKMPTWKWICSLASHRKEEVLLADSLRMRVVVCKAVISVGASWLERFRSGIPESARAHVLKGELRALAQPRKGMTWQVSEQSTCILGRAHAY